MSYTLFRNIEAENARLLEEADPSALYPPQNHIMNLLFAYNHYMQQIVPIQHLYDDILQL